MFTIVIGHMLLDLNLSTFCLFTSIHETSSLNNRQHLKVLLKRRDLDVHYFKRKMYEDKQTVAGSIPPCEHLLLKRFLKKDFTAVT